MTATKLKSATFADATYNPDYGPNRGNLQPGHYYVSVINGDRQVLALGPFHCHADALAQVATVRRYVIDHDVRGSWYAYGTARVEGDDPPTGALNTALEVTPS